MTNRLAGSKRPARDRSNPIQVYVNPDEREAIRRLAQACGMTVSAYMRTVASGQKVKSMLDIDAVTELARVNSEQSKLTRFLSLTPDTDERRNLLKRISAMQEQLIEVAKRIRT